MIGRAVIGASFGDEGKGLVTDYLCRKEGAGMVVRFNGGAQAGHTVQDNNHRHVFKHLGAGTFSGVPTFLSQFFVCNPILFFKELDELGEMGLCPTVYAHPDCLITTFADMINNQVIESKRADSRHGSCGIGFNETIERSQLIELKITMSDLWNGVNLEEKLTQICGNYSEFRTGKSVDIEDGIEAFMKGCEAFANFVNPLGISQCKDPVFEGAQGLLLDQNNKEYFPHLTRSNTGMANVQKLCAQAGITEIDPYYVSRTYLTRHGAGALPGEDTGMMFEELTNLPNDHQGSMRFAELDDVWLRCWNDSGGMFKKVLTHCDQLAPTGVADLYSFGPTAADINIRPDQIEAA